MRAWVLLIAIAACGSAKDSAPAGDPWPRCTAVLHERLAVMGPLDGVVACRELFRPACARAMRMAEPGMTLDDGRAILTACAKAYCPLSDQPLCGPSPSVRDAVNGAKALLTAGLAGVHPSDPTDVAYVADLLAGELLPARPRVLRITVDGDHATFALDAGDASEVPLHATAADFAPMVTALQAADDDLGGLLVWGSEALAPDARTAFFHALSRANISAIACMPDGRNCKGS